MSLASARYAVHPGHGQSMSTQELREHFLIDRLFLPDSIRHIYTHFDRLIIGGAMPVTKPLSLESFTDLKADFYLQRREIGIVNVGAAGTVTVDDQIHRLDFKEALYIGQGTRKIVFASTTEKAALFYFNSAPAHSTYPTRKVSLKEVESVDLGAPETSNQRTIRKLIVNNNSSFATCQLQMGLTELKKGSVWNTMPPHTHSRRMEAYFYFEIPENNSVCHFMGEPQETRHIWVKNNEAIISPPWSIHCGAGTSNYSFIWGMAGENQEYTDMDALKVTELK